MIAAEGEQKASRALREAANVIAESSSALQVRETNAMPINLRVFSIISRGKGQERSHYVIVHSNLDITDESVKTFLFTISNISVYQM